MSNLETDTPKFTKQVCWAEAVKLAADEGPNELMDLILSEYEIKEK